MTRGNTSSSRPKAGRTTRTFRWVSPFGNPRIDGYSHLPTAYRSVSRPSSPLIAKASTKRPSCARSDPEDDAPSRKRHPGPEDCSRKDHAPPPACGSDQARPPSDQCQDLCAATITPTPLRGPAPDRRLLSLHDVIENVRTDEARTPPQRDKRNARKPKALRPGDPRPKKDGTRNLPARANGGSGKIRTSDLTLIRGAL